MSEWKALYEGQFEPYIVERWRKTYGGNLGVRYIGGIDPYPLTTDECINPLLLLV